LFEAYPAIQTFGWEYPLQWNDNGYEYYHPRHEELNVSYTDEQGDLHTIEFRAYEDQEFDEWYIELDEGRLDIDENRDTILPVIRPMLEGVAAFLEAFTMEELAMFTGNNVAVSVSRETFEVTKYDDPY
jgi:hypothetical protein